MTALDTDDLAVITGPLVWNNDIDRKLAPQTNVMLIPGEVVRVDKPEDQWGTVWAYGFESRLTQFINASSLTPLSEIHAISGADGFERATAPLQQGPEVLWGETPYVVFSDIHDYVYVEGDE